MNKLHKRRLYFIGVFTLGLSLTAGLILYSLRQNINVFMTPSQLISAQISSDYYVRLGGMVKPGSLKHDPNNLNVNFIVTDLKKDIPVHYTGVLPDLFREGKGVVAEGRLNSQGQFNAAIILAKHDENYMPKNVYKAMREGNG